MFTLSINCKTAEELADIVAKLGDAAPAETPRSRKAPAEDEPAPRSRRAPAEDEPAPRGKKGAPSEDDLREDIRAKLRDLAGKTDRKAAMKVLNKYADSVDEVDKEDLSELQEKIEDAIAAA